MVIKCPNCDGALEYDIASGLLVCKFCKASFTAEEIGGPETDPADEEEQQAGNSYAAGAAGDNNVNAAGTMNPAGPGFAESGNENKAGYVFNISQEERARRRTEYYAEQARLSEEYNKRKKIDYSKPFAGMAASAAAASSEGQATPLTAEERKNRVNEYYAEQARLHSEYENRPQIDYSKPFAGTSRENMTMEEIQIANYEDEVALNNKLNQIAQENKDYSLRGSFFALGSAASASQNTYSHYSSPLPNMYSSFKPQDKKGNLSAQYSKKGEDGYLYSSTGARIIQNAGGMYVTTSAPPDVGADTMDNRIYTCTSCGAELALTGVETSSFCAYCGQPTIVFDRMETCTKPDYIIPFVITRDQALKLVRDRLNRGSLIPNEVKNFQVEKLCGIYIPYWLFDASYSDSMVIKSRVKQGKTTTTKYYRVNSRCKLFYFPVDASKKLNDNSSRKLDPWDYSGIRPFNISYMSGFYSDRFDMGSDAMTMMAMSRAQNMMYNKVQGKVPGSPQGIVDSAPIFHVSKKYYTMLPAWFLSFKYEGISYTIMVNGQTGKVAGAVPYEKGKFIGLFGGLLAAFSAVAIPLCTFMTKAILTASSKSDDSFKVLALPIIAAIVMYIAAAAKMKKYKKNMELTKEDAMNKFVKERQEI